MIRLAVLASGGGSITAAVIDAVRTGTLSAEVVAVIADRRPAGVLEVAAREGVVSLLVDPHDHTSRAGWDRALADTLRCLAPDWVAGLGFMRLLGPVTLGAFPGRIVNTHPSLLPAFPGRHAVRDALAAGVSETGCTVHVVDEGMDTGPVIAQRPVPVLAGEDEEILHERIKEVERVLVVDVLSRLATLGVRDLAARR